MTKMSPIESEFASTQDAEAHDAWVRAKVQRALTSQEPSIPHAEVMAGAKELIEKRRAAAPRLAR